MATEAEILTKLNALLDDISATLDAAGASKLVTLDRNTGADSALMYLRQSGDERFRVGLPAGDKDFVIQHSPDGSPLSYADVLRIDSDTGAISVSGLDINGATVSGQALFAGGSAAAPSIAFTGDPDTGLFSPGAGQIAAVVGGVRAWTASSAGTEFANVLAVSGDQPIVSIVESDDGASHRLISSGGALYIQADGTGSLSDSGRLFLTGRIGVELQDLTVKAAASKFECGGSEVARFTPTGLGIGTSSPAYDVDVNGSFGVRGGAHLHGNVILNTDDFRIYPSTTDGADTARVALLAGGAFSTSRGAYIFACGNEHATDPGNITISAGNIAGSEVRITAAEGVKILSKLEVSTSGSTAPSPYADEATFRNESGASGISILGRADNSTSVYFGDTDDPAVGRITYSHSTDVMSFLVNASERMRIDSAGNLLIGTTTPGASKLRVSGLPTNSAGLSPGDVWNDAGTLKIA